MHVPDTCQSKFCLHFKCIPHYGTFADPSIFYAHTCAYTHCTHSHTYTQHMHTHTHIHTYTHIHTHIALTQHAHTHGHTHTLAHTHWHTHMGTHTWAHAHGHTHGHTHMGTHTWVHTHIGTHTWAHTHGHTHMGTHAHGHTHGHTHMGTHTWAHTHTGWLKTFEDYYASQTRSILTLITDALAANSKRRFIWAEISYLDLWWQEQSSSRREQFRRYVLLAPSSLPALRPHFLSFSLSSLFLFPLPSHSSLSSPPPLFPSVYVYCLIIALPSSPDWWRMVRWR